MYKTLYDYDNNITINPLEKNKNNYFKKLTLIFGPSCSGKSTIINEIMYLCRLDIPSYFVVCPSNLSNDQYNNLPSICVKNKLEVSWLETLWDRQKNASEAYSITNNIDNLYNLFRKIASESKKNLVLELIDKTNKALQKINNNNNISYSDKKKNINNKKKKKNNFLKNLYKNTIKEYNNKNYKNIELTQIDKICIKYIDFNPNIMLILDDCASTFKEIYKKTNIIKKIFYEGRHFNITTVISSQNDKEISSELRKNSFITIFTNLQTSLTNFTRSSNNYSKDMQKKAINISKLIFSNSKNEKYRKLVYIRDVEEPFFHTTANIYEDLKFCCDYLWILDNIINKKNNELNNNNPFFNNLDI